MPFTVRDLIGERGKPVTARPDELVQVALRRMRDYDYSQLPVVEGDDVPIGMLTSSSILRVLSHVEQRFSTLLVDSVMERKPDEYQSDDDLFDLLDDLRDTYAVLVVDATGRLTGIVTSYDTTEYFRRRAEDMMLLEDIEGTIKDLIRMAGSLRSPGDVENVLSGLAATVGGARSIRRKEAQRVTSQYLRHALGEDKGQLQESAFTAAFEKVFPKEGAPSFHDLSLNDFNQLLLDDGVWPGIGHTFGLEKDSVRKLLDDVRKTRNSLAHFRGTLSSDEADRLRYCADLLVRARKKLVVGQNPAQTLERTPVPQSDVSSMEPDVEAEEPDESRYARLARFLQSSGDAGQTRVVLSIDDIEGIVKGRLPDSARKHRSWWANDAVSHSQSRQWIDAGWKVSDVDLISKRITFEREIARSERYMAFNIALRADLRKTALPLRSQSSTDKSWMWLVDLPEGRRAYAHLGVSFALADRFRVELYLDGGNGEENKRSFDKLFLERDEIARGITGTLQWERLDNRRASRIALYRQGSIMMEPAVLEELRAWAVQRLQELYAVLAKRLS